MNIKSILLQHVKKRLYITIEELIETRGAQAWQIDAKIPSYRDGWLEEVL